MYQHTEFLCCTNCNRQIQLVIEMIELDIRSFKLETAFLINQRRSKRKVVQTSLKVLVVVNPSKAIWTFQGKTSKKISTRVTEAAKKLNCLDQKVNFRKRPPLTVVLGPYL